MEREEFLKKLGIGMALVCTGACFQSCGKKGDENPSPSSGGGTASVDISALANVGSSTTSGGVLFIRLNSANAASSFVATEALCPHQQGNLVWQQSANRIQCTSHAATYSSSGVVLSTPTDGGSTRALKIYPVTLTGTTLIATKN